MAAASGLTTSTAAASTNHPRLAAASKQMLGPGPLSTHYQLGGYRILFSDTRNKATRPGRVTIELRYQGHPLSGASVQLTYRSLDMTMPTHEITLRANRRQGRYSHQAPRLSMGGRWQITITIRPQPGPTLQLKLTDLIIL